MDVKLGLILKEQHDNTCKQSAEENIRACERLRENINPFLQVLG
jgi:hypothetical protein